MYHFLSGYTAKVAGTEKGVTSRRRPSRPVSARRSCRATHRFTATCSRPDRARAASDCWLVNTGWTGGKYGAGKRMPINATRALLNAALDGSLKTTKFRKDPNFGFDVPVELPGCTELLDRAERGPIRPNMMRWPETR